MYTRREIMQRAGNTGLTLAAMSSGIAGETASHQLNNPGPMSGERPRPVRLFLCGDVMTGRGIDQILPHPSNPRIYEDYVRSAVDYVTMAERTNGPIPRPIAFDYVWGEALDAFERFRPDLRIINLETSITTSEDRVDKGINYRMHPGNVSCLTAAKIGCCTLANNHVLDWGYRGLADTLDALRRAKVNTAGAGHNLVEALEPAVAQVRLATRVLVFAFGEPGSGIPQDWSATANKAGIAFLPALSPSTATSTASRIRMARRSGDMVVVSIHWGHNWGYMISPEQQSFAHRLVDEGAADIVYGHSSHHPKGIEVYRNKLILYGCGDFLNDYEGIGGYEAFRSHLALMYFATLEPTTGSLIRLEMTPLEIKRFRLQHPSRESERWLRDTLDREGRKLGTRVELGADHVLNLRWT